MDKKKQDIIFGLKALLTLVFEVVKSNSGQIALNNKDNTKPFVMMNDIGYLTPTPYQWYLIEDEIKRLEKKMDKQKQIEEMEKDIAVRMAMAKGVAGSMNKGVEGWLSEYLINEGWCKGFSREEVDEISETAIKNSRKNTVEKFAERLKEIAKDKLELYGWQMVDIDDIDEICKELTEG